MAKVITVADAINGYLLSRKQKRCSEKTIKWYRYKLIFMHEFLEKEFEVTKLKDVDVMQLRLFIDSVSQTEVDARNPHKPTREGVLVRDITVKGYVQVVKSFFSWCAGEELIKKNPGTKLDNPKVGESVIKTFSDDQIRLMLDVCDTGTVVGFRDYMIILLLLDTGIRVAELCSLTLDRIYLEVLDEAFIRIMGKGRKEREVGISSEVAQCLWKYIHAYRSPNSEATRVLLVNRYGEPLTANGVEQMLKEAVKRALRLGDGLKLDELRVSPHTFRHTFACKFLENGGEIYKLSLLLGHSSVKVTERYLKDFYSKSARKDQMKYSPVVSLSLAKSKKGGFRKASKIGEK